MQTRGSKHEKILLGSTALLAAGTILCGPANAQIEFGLGGFTLGGSFAQNLDDPAVGDMTGYDLGASYGTGPLAVSLSWYHGERDGGGTALEAEHDSVHLFSNYNLGPGVRFSGTLGYMGISDESAGREDNTAWYIVAGPNLGF